MPETVTRRPYRDPRRDPVARTGPGHHPPVHDTGGIELENRTVHRRALHEPPPGIGTDLGVSAELAARRRYGRGCDIGPRAVLGELRRASAGGPADYAGVTWERIDAEDGVFRPCPEDDHPGTPQLFPHPARRTPSAGRTPYPGHTGTAGGTPTSGGTRTAEGTRTGPRALSAQTRTARPAA
jgi:hypothetical protein